jgi:hypothetical protein
MIPSCRFHIMFMLLWLAALDLRNAAAFLSVDRRGGLLRISCTPAPADIAALLMSARHRSTDEHQESCRMERSASSSSSSSSRRAFLTLVSSATTVVVAQTSWAECSCAADEVAMDLMASQKFDLIEEIRKDTKDDIKAEKDTNKLISSLKSVFEEVKAEKDAPPPAPPKAPEAAAAAASSTKQSGAMTVSSEKKDLAKAMQLIDGETRDLIDLLEQEEEQIAVETVKLMRKVETLEAASERLNKPLLDEPDAKNSDEAVAKSQAETYAFLEKLKKRSTEKEDFINLLKLESSAFASGGKIDLKLPEFITRLRKTSEADREFDLSLNAFRERLQRGLGMPRPN